LPGLEPAVDAQPGMPIIASLPGFDLNFPEHAVPAAPHFTTGPNSLFQLTLDPSLSRLVPRPLPKKLMVRCDRQSRPRQGMLISMSTPLLANFSLEICAQSNGANRMLVAKDQLSANISITYQKQRRK
jgi:hypothetical protein